MKRLLGNKKVIIALAAVIVLAAVFLLKDRLFSAEDAEEPEEPTPIEAPGYYKLGETQIPAMPAGASMLVYLEEPKPLSAAASEEQEDTEEAEEPEETDSADEEETVTLIAYRYEGMTNAASVVAAYAALLTTEDMGFLYAEESLQETEEAPDLSAESGSAYLVHRFPKPEGGGERQAIAMGIRWETGICTVTLEQVPAAMTYPPKSAAQVGNMQAITFSSAVDRIKAISPSVLELDGDSMEMYRVYSRDGLVMINGQSCMRIDIYRVDEKHGTNIIAGNYFLSSDGLHLYRFLSDENSVHELSMRAATPAVSKPAVSKPAEEEKPAEEKSESISMPSIDVS